MSYDEYPELWEEASKQAEKCNECTVNNLDVPNGDSKHYIFCQRHHWKFHREYMIKRRKGEKGKDDFDPEELAKSMSEETGRNVTLPKTEYTSETMDDLAVELVEKLEDDHGGFRESALRNLERMAEYDPSLLAPVSEKLMNTYLTMNWENPANTRSDVESTLPTILGKIATAQPNLINSIGELVQEKNYQKRIAGLNAFKEIANTHPELLIETKCEKQSKGILAPFTGILTSSKKVSAYSLVVENLEFKTTRGRYSEHNSRQVRAVSRSIMKLLSDSHPEKVAPHLTKVVRFEENPEETYRSIITLANVGKEYPEKVEDYSNKVESYLGKTRRSIEGEYRDFSGAASIFFLQTEIKQDKFSEKKLKQEVRSLVDASKYEEEKQIDAIRCLGHVGSKDDIEIITFFKTDYSTRRFIQKVDEAVERINSRN